LCAPLTQRRPDPPKPSMARAQLLTASALFCLVLGASNLRCRQCLLEEPYLGLPPRILAVHQYGRASA
ncbi:lymphocyte antigen 6 complex, locus G5B, partial [Chelydra serpentina]